MTHVVDPSFFLYQEEPFAEAVNTTSWSLGRFGTAVAAPLRRLLSEPGWRIEGSGELAHEPLKLGTHRQFAFVANARTSEPRRIRAFFSTAVLDSTTSDIFQSTYDSARHEFANMLTSFDRDDLDLGIANEFERQLRDFFSGFRHLAIVIVDAEIDSLARTDRDIASGIIDALGADRDPVTHSMRFDLLRRALETFSAPLRDAAALAVYRIGDVQALPLLEAARARESNAQLRRNFDQLIDRLRRV